MDTRVRTCLVAITSAATTAALFAACGAGAGVPVQAPGAGVDSAAPPSPPAARPDTALVAIDRHPVATGGELRGYIENNTHPGDTVTVTVLRGDERHELAVTLAERPSARPGQ